MTAPTAIDLRHITLQRGRRTILKNVTWSVPAQGCAAILGPNGSGKSTLARIIMGQIWPTRGSVSVLGQKFGQTDLNHLRQSIRLVQPAAAVEFDPQQSTTEIVLTGFFGTVGLYDAVTPSMRKTAARLVAQVGLKKESNQAYATLSSGERMRCLIARALVVQPQLLLLDEPTAGLDLLAREQVLATVQQLIRRPANRPAVVMITHHVEELLPETTHVLLLKTGRAAASGRPRDVLRSDILSNVYDFHAKVTRRAGRYWIVVHPSAWKGLLNSP